MTGPQAGELAGLTKSQVLVVVVGEDGQTHSFATPHMQHFLDHPTMQQTLRECLEQSPSKPALYSLADSLTDLSLSSP